MRMPMMIMLDNGRGLWSPVGIRHRREVHISLKKSYGLTGGDYRDYFDNDFFDDYYYEIVWAHCL